jgi:hypothetical protein
MRPAPPAAELSQLVAVLADFPGLTVLSAQGKAAAWIISCLIENTPTGEESLSWVSFVFDRKLEADLVEMTIGGQHYEHSGQGCFSLLGRDVQANTVANLLSFARSVWREHESPN